MRVTLISNYDELFLGRAPPARAPSAPAMGGGMGGSMGGGMGGSGGIDDSMRSLRLSEGSMGHPSFSSSNMGLSSSMGLGASSVMGASAPQFSISLTSRGIP